MQDQNLHFLVLLKGYLPDKSVSIAAPSSYWYLKHFPIEMISEIVDYIVFMTYDLHGQITKAGVPSNKVVVGVTSHGRSFAMADAGCYGPDCFYTGTAMHSNAEPGVCTGQAGYIANAEIKQILSDPSRVNQHFIDDSDSNILVYDNIQWVSWMDDHFRSVRTQLYQALGLGTTDWATDLESFSFFSCSFWYSRVNPREGARNLVNGFAGHFDTFRGKIRKTSREV
ncbi:hypothetical protein F1880_001969 [Penicillium rolfsii]|nr:hypothetical protein F1880_001969 [Penicillium rolfsii]